MAKASTQDKKMTKRRAQQSDASVAALEAAQQALESAQEAVEAAQEAVAASQTNAEDGANGQAKANVQASAEDSADVQASAEDSADVQASAKDSADVQASAKDSEQLPRYDILISSERPGYRPPRAAVASMVQMLAFRGFASPYEEAVAQTWAEVYFKPGTAGHELFIDKGYDSDVEVFKELCLRFSEKPSFYDYSSTPQRPVYWSIEVRGARFKQINAAVKKLFLEALNLRVAVDHREFTALPPHQVVPEDEQPIEKKKRERGAGLAGTEVEEM